MEDVFDIFSQSMEATYDALRKRREYFSYRTIDAFGGDHLERLTTAEKVSNRMRPASSIIGHSL